MDHRALEATRPALALIGHSGAGKDVACIYLSRYPHFKWRASTSWYLAPLAAPAIGVPVDVLRGPDRHRYKEDLFRIGNALRDAEPGLLAHMARADGNIISGLRDPRELEVVRRDRLADLVVWIDRDVPADPTMRDFGPTPWRHADVRVSNEGNLDDFFHRLDTLVAALLPSSTSFDPEYVDARRRSAIYELRRRGMLPAAGST